MIYSTIHGLLQVVNTAFQHFSIRLNLFRNKYICNNHHVDQFPHLTCKSLQLLMVAFLINVFLAGRASLGTGSHVFVGLQLFPIFAICG